MPYSNNPKSHARRDVGLMLMLLVLIAASIRVSTPTAFTAIKPAVNAPPSAIWSAPVSVGTAISSPFSDQGPALSPDGLSLYFTSNRIGGGSLGGFDMWVSHRASVTDPWGAR